MQTSSQQALATHGAPSDANLPVEVADWLATLTDELLAPAKRRAYRSAVRLWAEFAASVGASAMPPDEGALLT